MFLRLPLLDAHQTVVYLPDYGHRYDRQSDRLNPCGKSSQSHREVHD